MAVSRFFLVSGLAIFMCFPKIYGQAGTVMVTMAVTPPYTSKIDDYISQPNKIMATFLNTGPYPLDVYVLGSIRSEGGINVYTDPGYAMSPPLTLLPGVPYTLSRFNLEQVFDEEHLECQGITLREVLYGNGLPEEDYTICMQVFDYETGEPVSAESPQGCSNTFTVAGLEPPVITFPVSGQDIMAEEPQNVIFSWTRPPGAPVNTEFVLKLIEILPSDRNINDAFNSARSPLFFEKTLTTSQYLLGPADPRLVPGKSYAFSVTAVDPAQNLSFRNNGVSEIASFNYIKPEPACGGWPVAWDVNTVRRITYLVNTQEKNESKLETSESYTITLDFLGEGVVNYSVSNASVNSVIKCLMSPYGNLYWVESKQIIPTPILAAFNVLKNPIESINNGDNWTRYGLNTNETTDPYGDALILNYKVDYNALSEVFIKNMEMYNIGLNMFYRIEPTNAAQKFYELNGITDPPFNWENYINGVVLFNCAHKCTEKAEFNIISTDEQKSETLVTIEREIANEIKSSN